jgi:hypothetical protein
VRSCGSSRTDDANRFLPDPRRNILDLGDRDRRGRSKAITNGPNAGGDVALQISFHRDDSVEIEPRLHLGPDLNEAELMHEARDEVLDDLNRLWRVRPSEDILELLGSSSPQRVLIRVVSVAKNGREDPIALLPRAKGPKLIQVQVVLPEHFTISFSERIAGGQRGRPALDPLSDRSTGAGPTGPSSEAGCSAAAARGPSATTSAAAVNPADSRQETRQSVNAWGARPQFRVVADERRSDRRGGACDAGIASAYASASAACGRRTRSGASRGGGSLRRGACRRPAA